MKYKHRHYKEERRSNPLKTNDAAGDCFNRGMHEAPLYQITMKHLNEKQILVLDKSD
jgi:hypothetical protein